MLFLLLTLIIVLPCLVGWGKLCAKILYKNTELNLSISAIVGVIALSTIWTVMAFFYRISFSVEFVSILIGWAAFIKYKLYKNFYALFSETTHFEIFIFISILFAGSFSPYILDHFGYYVPSILWLKNEGLVRGISNLDLVLGQMSTWHIFQAGFSHVSDVFLRINTVLLVVFLLYIKEKKCDSFLLFIPILLLFIQSPSPDLPCILFALILLKETLSQTSKLSFLFTFSVYIFTIKPTLIWAPIFIFLYLVSYRHTIWRNGLFGFLLLLLFCCKNIYTFGYPIFPIAWAAPSLPWQPHPDIMALSSQYAIQKTYDMQYTLQEIRAFSIGDYMKNWVTLSGLKAYINIFFLLILLVFSYFTWKQKKKIITLLWVAILIKSIVTLIFSAQYRFFIDVFFIILWLVYLQKTNRIWTYSISGISTVVVLLFLSFPMVVAQMIPSYKLSFYMASFSSNQLLKPNEYQYNKYQTFVLENLKFNVSKKYPFNFDSPPPAISEGAVEEFRQIGIFPQWVDKRNIKKGFVWKKNTALEQKKIDSMIHFIKKEYVEKQTKE